MSVPPTTARPSHPKLAAAALNAAVSAVGLAVSIAPLPRGAAAVAADGNQPPFAALVAGVVLGVLGLVGSVGIWRCLRWGTVLTIVVRALDAVSSLPGLSADSATLAVLAWVSVVTGVLVIALLLRRERVAASARQ